ncbi:Putrescine importer [Nostocoides japonicum T1-X7]|uniref:Putrescine importer n=1 Tax=Nostocoides japonicum T1-X7 TaxID=1194083 RepID=A0A077M7C1_9MICO|nr:APC family permease [Tetrasphaera japonica]CCH79955.1 Putrescine importer [Tetrasphaera japonica T1-X7]
MTESTSAADGPTVANPGQTGAVTEETHLKRVLGLPAIVLFGVAYMVPLTVFSTLGPVSELTDNHLVGSYVLTLLGMMFTALSYGVMSRRYPVAGSAYTYSQRTFGGALGFLTGWALLLDYILLPMINYMLIGLYLNTAFPSIPSWVFFLLALALVTGLNIRGITSVSRMNTVFVVVQVVFCIVFAVLVVRTASGQGSVPNPWNAVFGGGAHLGTLLTGAAILCLSFLGFDAVSTLSEEARNPRRDIPRGIVLVTLIGGLIFIVLALLSYLVIPDWHSFEHVDTASAEVIRAAGGSTFSNAFVAAYVAGGLGSALASQASVSRILFTMGRDQVLPHSVFGVLNSRTKTPVRAILVVSAVSLVGLLLPLSFAISIISFGALTGFTMVNLSVFKAYVINDHRRSPRDMMRYFLLPAIGFVLTVWLWTSLPHNAILLGLLWTVVGAGQLARITGGFRRKPPQMDLQEIA